jgi:hypothetical protein
VLATYQNWSAPLAAAGQSLHFVALNKLFNAQSDFYTPPVTHIIHTALSYKYYLDTTVVGRNCLLLVYSFHQYWKLSAEYGTTRAKLEETEARGKK